MSAAGLIELGPGEGKSRRVLGLPFSVKAPTEKTRGAYFMAELTVAKDGPPLHVHRNDDEALYVIEGALNVRIEDRTMTARIGSFHLIPRGTVHTVWNEQPEPARVLLIFSPGEFQQFVEEANDLTDMDKIAAVAEKNGLQIIETPADS